MNKVFQIYIGKPSDFELACMRETVEMFDTYLFFSDNVEGAFPLSSIENAVKRCKYASYLYSKATTLTQKSDILRYTFLAENPDYWYLDCDATLESFPVIEGNRPFFAEYMDGADGFIIYGNNNQSVFKLILKSLYLRVKNGESLNKAPYHSIKKQPGIIPRTYFKHKGI